MHHNGFVVSICDTATGRAYREFDHKRDGGNSSVRLTVPFDSEYGFLFKVTDGRRRRVEITIDGTAIGVGAVVVPGYGQCVLERFLDSDKRFKFVPVTAEGVADPSSNENGVIVVKAWTERRPPELPLYLRSAATRSAGGQHTNSSRRSWAGGSGVTGQSIGSSHDGATVSSWDAGAPAGQTVFSSQAMPENAAAGATIEGSKSDQHLASTQWDGDETPFPQEFHFKLVGTTVQQVAGFCTECQMKLRKTDKFCARCGTKVLAPV